MQTSKWISGQYYVNADGTMAISQLVDNNKYYVDASGKWVKTTKWLTINGKWHYIISGKVQQSKWVEINSKWYYFDASGVMQTSKWIGGKYYVKAMEQWQFQHLLTVENIMSVLMVNGLNLQSGSR